MSFFFVVFFFFLSFFNRVILTVTLQKHSAAEADCCLVLAVCVCEPIASTSSSSHSLRLFPMLCGGLGYPLPLVTTIPSRCPPPPLPPPHSRYYPIIPLPFPPSPHPQPASFGRRAQIGQLSTVIRRRELVRLPFHFDFPVCSFYFIFPQTLNVMHILHHKSSCCL